MAEYEKRSGPSVDRKPSKSSSEPSEFSEYDSGPDVHLDAKTFLAVFAALLIYFAQLVSLVGAGAVSLYPMPSRSSYRETWSDRLCPHSKAKPSQLTSILRQALSGLQGLLRFSLSSWGRYSHMPPTTGAGNGFLSSRLCWAELDRSSLPEPALSECV